MQDLPISYFPIAERQHCSEALQKLFAELEATLGFVPNVIRAFAWQACRRLNARCSPWSSRLRMIASTA